MELQFFWIQTCLDVLKEKMKLSHGCWLHSEWLFLTVCAWGDRLCSWEIPSMWLVQLCLIAWFSFTVDLSISPCCICTCGCLPIAAFKQLPNTAGLSEFASAFEHPRCLNCANLSFVDKEWGNRVPSAVKKKIFCNSEYSIVKSFLPSWQRTEINSWEKQKLGLLLFSKLFLCLSIHILFLCFLLSWHLVSNWAGEFFGIGALCYLLVQCQG